MNRVIRWFGGALVVGLLAGCGDDVAGPRVTEVQRASSLQQANVHHDFDFDKDVADDSTKAKPKKGRYAMGAN